MERELGKTLEELVAEARQQPGGEEILRNWAAETMRHHSNPLYHKAAEWTAKARAAAINKGAGKYPQPLNPHTYTFLELFDHAMAENIDQQHYLTALRMKYEAFEQMLDGAENALRAIREITAGTVGANEVARVHVIAGAYFNLKEIYGGHAK